MPLPVWVLCQWGRWCHRPHRPTGGERRAGPRRSNRTDRSNRPRWSTRPHWSTRGEGGTGPYWPRRGFRPDWPHRPHRSNRAHRPRRARWCYGRHRPHRCNRPHRARWGSAGGFLRILCHVWGFVYKWKPDSFRDCHRGPLRPDCTGGSAACSAFTGILFRILPRVGTAAGRRLYADHPLLQRYVPH